MTKVNIDNKDYDFDKLSDKVKATLLSLNFVQAELKKLNAQQAVYKTAEVAYQKSLKKELDSEV